MTAIGKYDFCSDVVASLLTAPQVMRAFALCIRVAGLAGDFLYRNLRVIATPQLTIIIYIYFVTIQCNNYQVPRYYVARLCALSAPLPSEPKLLEESEPPLEFAGPGQKSILLATSNWKQITLRLYFMSRLGLPKICSRKIDSLVIILNSFNFYKLQSLSAGPGTRAPPPGAKGGSGKRPFF